MKHLCKLNLYSVRYSGVQDKIILVDSITIISELIQGISWVCRQDFTLLCSWITPEYISTVHHSIFMLHELDLDYSSHKQTHYN